MTIERLKNLLTNLEKMENAGIAISDNLLQAIDSLVGQLDLFMEDSLEKAEFDAMERHDIIIDIFLSLWKIFYDHLYQQISLEHRNFIYIVGNYHFNSNENVRKKDIMIRLRQIHDMLVTNFSFMQGFKTVMEDITKRFYDNKSRFVQFLHLCTFKTPILKYILLCFNVLFMKGLRFNSCKNN
jgi:hypothetical protein